MAALSGLLTACNFTINGCEFTHYPGSDPDDRFFTATCPGADLSGADLSNLWLMGATLPGADLTGANFDDSTILGGVYDDVDFSGATFDNTWVVEVTANRVTFAGADLDTVIFDELWSDDSDFSDTPVVPASQTVDANGPAGALVTWPPAIPVGGEEGVTPGACDHASGSLFPVGSTVVRCEVELYGASGNFGTFTVTVLPPA